MGLVESITRRLDRPFRRPGLKFRMIGNGAIMTVAGLVHLVVFNGVLGLGNDGLGVLLLWQWWVLLGTMVALTAFGWLTFRVGLALPPRTNPPCSPSSR